MAGLLIEVDGETYTAPHSFDWEPGSIHTIGVASPQKIKSQYADFIRYLFAKWSDGGAQSHSVTASSPPLEPGPYFIAVHIRTQGVRVNRNLTASLTVSESEIAARVPAFGIPASLITTTEGETPAPQILEIRNSGRGTLDYQIATDPSWLSVSPDQGSSAGETDTVEITVGSANLEPGAFEGTITITERQPAGGFAGLFSDRTPAWPVKVPVTFIVIPESWEDPSDTTPTIPEDDEEESEEDEDESEEDEDESGGPAVEARLYAPNDVVVGRGRQPLHRRWFQPQHPQGRPFGHHYHDRRNR